MLAIALALVGCGGGDNEDATPPPPIAEPSTLPPDPYAVPAVIDAAYVNRVLEGLDAAVGEVVRIVVRTRDIPPEVIDRIKAIFITTEDQNLELAALQDTLREGLTSIRPNPGNKKSVVKELINASQDCIYVHVERDYSAVGTTPNMQPTNEWIVLRPGDAARYPDQYNPTPWAIASNGLAPPRAEPC